MTLHGDALVPLARAADITGLTYATIYGAGLRGHLRLRRMGKRLFVPLIDLQTYAEKAARRTK